MDVAAVCSVRVDIAAGVAIATQRRAQSNRLALPALITAISESEMRGRCLRWEGRTRRRWARWRRRRGWRWRHARRRRRCWRCVGWCRRQGHRRRHKKGKRMTCKLTDIMELHCIHWCGARGKACPVVHAGGAEFVVLEPGPRRADRLQLYGHKVDIRVQIESINDDAAFGGGGVDGEAVALLGGRAAGTIERAHEALVARALLTTLWRRCGGGHDGRQSWR